MKWRLQASWSVGDARRSYAPLWEDSESEAEQAAAEMLKTLDHFVALEISIEPVSDDEAAAEAKALGLNGLADDRPVVHLLKPDRTIACGMAVEDAGVFAMRETFELGAGDLCEKCRRTSW